MCLRDYGRCVGENERRLFGFGCCTMDLLVKKQILSLPYVTLSIFVFATLILLNFILVLFDA